MPKPKLSVHALALGSLLVGVTGIANAQFNTFGRSQLRPYIQSPTRPLVSRSIPSVTGANYPRVSGSYSTAVFSQLVTAEVFGIPAEMRTTLKDWGRFDEGASASLRLDFSLGADLWPTIELNKLITYTNLHQGVRKAYFLLADKQMDLIFVERPPSPNEIKSARENGVEFELRPIALDALVFFTGYKSPITTLTLEQIRSCYQQQGLVWPMPNAGDFKLLPADDTRDSDSYPLMRQMVMNDTKYNDGYFDGPTPSFHESVIQTVYPINERLAYALYYDFAYADQKASLKMLAINGVLPSAKTIASQQYPLTTPLYAVTRKGTDPTSPTMKVRDYLLTRDGQKLVARSGFVPIGSSR